MSREREGFNPEKNKEAAFDVENIEEVKKQVNAIRELLDETGYIGCRWSPEAKGHLSAALVEGEKILENLKKRE